MASSEGIGGEKQDAAAAQSLGVRLREARQAQGLSVEDVAGELRIGAHQLEALEACRFDTLGPPVFARGYLKQYGARLGLDVALLVADYERTVGHTTVEIAPSRTIKLRDERQMAIWVLAALVLALIAVYLTLWWLRQSDGAPEPVQASVAESPVVTPEPAQPPPSRPAASVPAEPALASAPRAQGGAPVGTEPVAALAPVSSVEPDSDEIETAAGAAEEPAGLPDGSALEVLFVEDSWAEITDEDGERLYYQLGRAGTRVRFPADRNLNLLFGNVLGVELRIDGRRVSVPGSPQPGDIVRFDLNALGQ